jgi:hypothetical protein
VLRVGSSKKLDPTLNATLANICVLNYQDMTLMIINHISSVYWDSKVGTLPPC